MWPWYYYVQNIFFVNTRSMKTNIFNLLPFIINISYIVYYLINVITIIIIIMNFITRNYQVYFSDVLLSIPTDSIFNNDVATGLAYSFFSLEIYIQIEYFVILNYFNRYAYGMLWRRTKNTIIIYWIPSYLKFRVYIV